MAGAKPPSQVCSLCGFDDDVTAELATGEWVMRCTATSHPPWEWRPKTQEPVRGRGRSGVAEELGVYDELLRCVEDGYAETGLIEYRYSQRAPSTYEDLVRRYGHTAHGRQQYSASAFLATALRALWDEELVFSATMPATGYWSYNGRTYAYGPLGTDPEDVPLSWAEFAETTLGVSALDWPPLGFRAALG